MSQQPPNSPNSSLDDLETYRYSPPPHANDPLDDLNSELERLRNAQPQAGNNSAFNISVNGAVRFGETQVHYDEYESSTFFPDFIARREMSRRRRQHLHQLQAGIFFVNDGPEGGMAAAASERTAHELQLRRDEIESQNREFEASARADRQKMEKKIARQLQREAELQRESDIIEKKIIRKEKIRKKYFKACPEDNNIDVLHLCLRASDGFRVQKNFQRGNHLSLLHAFVYSHDDFPDRFRVVCNYPRRQLPCFPMGDVASHDPTFEEARVLDRSVIFINEVDEEDREGEEDGYEWLDYLPVF